MEGDKNSLHQSVPIHCEDVKLEIPVETIVDTRTPGYVYQHIPSGAGLKFLEQLLDLQKIRYTTTGNIITVTRT